MPTKINIKANIQSESKSTDEKLIGEKSLKSLRTYQMGIVYKDEYGRETPVFTNEGASFTVPKTVASSKNSIVTSVVNEAPSWANSYKFFIKETSNEYYNLCMDRWYDAEDENIWLSFPSAERNKVSEDTFLILKKPSGSNVAIKEKGKYKIIDIQNEAPDFIKTDYEKYGDEVLNIDSATAGNGFIEISWDDSNPGAGEWNENDETAGTNAFYDPSLTSGHVTALSGEVGHSGLSEVGFVGYKDENIVIDISNASGTTRTGWLDVSKIYKGSSTTVKVQLTKSLKDEVTSIVPSGGCTDCNVRIARKTVKNKPEFNGRFFVKINMDETIKTHVRSVGSPSTKYSVGPTATTYYITKEQYNPGGTLDGILYDHFWKDVGETWFIDKAQRLAVGSCYWGGGCGTSGPWDDHDGFGMIGTDSGKRSSSYFSNLRCTMELSLNKINDSSEGGFSLSNNSSNNQRFIQKMMTPGTKFRWKEDPYQVIYKIMGGTHSPKSSEGSNHEGGIYNYGSKNWQKEDSTNKCFRMYLKFKTTGMRLNAPQSDGASAVYQHFPEEADLWPFNYNGNDGSGNATYPSGNYTQQVPVANAAFDPLYKGYTTGSTGSAWGGDYGESIDNNLGQTNQNTSTGFNDASEMANTIQILDTDTSEEEVEFDPNPAIWETEPKEDKGLDIYYEASQAYPLFLDDKTNELFAPFGAKVSCVDTVSLVSPLSFFPNSSNKNLSLYLPEDAIIHTWEPEGHGGDTIWVSSKIDEIGIIDHDASIQYDQTLVEPNPTLASTAGIISALNDNFQGIEIRFTRPDGSYTTAKVVYFSGYNLSNYFIDGWDSGYSCPAGCGDNLIIKLDRNLANERIKLPYFNCYTFGNGVESDRIRDDFNAVRLDKGVKASTVLDEPYEEEQRTNGLIYSGIYNSTSGVNNLNQFIAAEKIIKDTQPSYGSIQKLKARDTNLVAFCEDKVLKIQANKDALYSADGKPQLIASNAVLGDVTTFAGEFGISKNPESFAEESFRMYFTDKQRGKVLRLSGDGITDISKVGMKDWFADNLKKYDTLIGSFDDRKEEYNLTMTNKTD